MPTKKRKATKYLVVGSCAMYPVVGSCAVTSKLRILLHDGFED